MTRILALSLFLLLACFALSGAADNPIVGKWDCIADGGQESAWTLTVAENDGKLSGNLSNGQADLPLVEPKLEGDRFTFKVVINDATYSVAAKIAAGKLDGTFEGPEAKGTIKGEKK